MDEECDTTHWVDAVFYAQYEPKPIRRSALKNPCKEISLETEQKDDTTMTTKKLYEFTHSDTRKYGHKLAVDSQGNWVMEVKGSGEVIAVDKKAVSEVMPYTIGVRFDSKGTVYHYLAESGKYAIGDVYVVDAPLGRAIVNVVELDTKNPMATKEFTYIAKLMTA